MIRRSHGRIRVVPLVVAALSLLLLAVLLTWELFERKSQLASLEPPGRGWYQEQLIPGPSHELYSVDDLVIGRVDGNDYIALSPTSDVRCDFIRACFRLNRIDNGYEVMLPVGYSFERGSIRKALPTGALPIAKLTYWDAYQHKPVSRTRPVAEQQMPLPTAVYR